MYNFINFLCHEGRIWSGWKTGQHSTDRGVRSLVATHRAQRAFILTIVITLIHVLIRELGVMKAAESSREPNLR